MRGIRKVYGVMMVVLVVIVVGCQVFDFDHGTAPTAPGDATTALNYIVLPGRITDWEAYYVPGASAFSVNIPMAGVMRIRYYLEGGCFALYLSALYPPLVEVGLEPNEDGTYPIVANVSVDYIENGSFTSLPANAVADEQPNYTKYLRQEADGNLSEWWPCEEGLFGWSGQFSTKDALLDGTLGADVTEGTLAPRPEPVVLGDACQRQGFTVGVCTDSVPVGDMIYYAWDGVNISLDTHIAWIPGVQRVGIINRTGVDRQRCWAGGDLWLNPQPGCATLDGCVQTATDGNGPAGQSDWSSAGRMCVYLR